MSTRSSVESVLDFTTVRTVGGLLPPDVLQRIVAGDADLGGLDPDKYGLARNDRVGEVATRAWRKAQAYWAAFRAATQDLPESESGVPQTREQWLLPLLRDLGYGAIEYRAAAEVVGERRYAISHRDGPVALHLVSYRQDLDHATPTVSGQRRVNPHALVQEYLNLSDSTYGLVSNGLQLRLLRDNTSLTRQTFVEFDLAAMLDGGVYADFVLFYLVLHRTRLPQPDQEAGQCWLEKWRERAEAQGTRALGALRGGVEAAIEVLGTGFLTHSANEDLRENLTSGRLDTNSYYRQLLRLIYRFLFLFVAEERHLIFPAASPIPVGNAPNQSRDPIGGGQGEGVPGSNRQRYYDHYSVTRLRTIAQKYLTDDRHDDLWRGLQVSFDLLGGRRSGLGLPALGGGLFDHESCPDLDLALLRNDALADAIRRLSWVRVKNVTRRVNYRDMDAEELGGVYESLLERQPQIVSGEFHATFKLVGSGERRQTGSYYTPTSLVQELIKSALDPVLDDRLKDARTSAEKKAALLGLTVCDPACGSGHFLLAAARRIAQEYARIEAGDAEPSEPQLRAALRQVIGRCIYGVDLNPLAVDLCELALWLEGHDPGRPLTFLDHRIKLGNSLVGVFDLGVLKAGIPDGAYAPVTGDDKNAAAGYKKLNKAERLHLGTLDTVSADREGFAERDREFAALATTENRTAADLRAIKELYAEYHARGTEYWAYKVACDLWTASFFAPLRLPKDGGLVPTTEMVRRSLTHPLGGLDAQHRAVANALSEEHQFFHWPLEFPEIVLERGGFDCVLGNPPWERIKLQEQEFFEDREPEIANAPNKAARQRRIDALAGTELGRRLFDEFQLAKRAAECESGFVRESGRFPLTAVGDVNLYALFAEHDRMITVSRGRAGVLVPTGIATDDTTKMFFSSLVSTDQLRSIVGFENEEFIFPSVHHSYKFSALTIGSPGAGDADLVFFCRRIEYSRDSRRHFNLTAQDFALVNPVTRTCPTFRTNVDAVLAKAIYRRVPVLIDGGSAPSSWSVEFLRMFDMSNDSGLFHGRPGPSLVPLYEAKLFHQFDHRYGTYEGATKEQLNVNIMPRPHTDQKANPSYFVQPRYWVEQEHVQARVPVCYSAQWFIGFRDVTSAISERTAIFCVLPRVGVGHKAPLVLLQTAPRISAALLANFNALVLDYLARQKVGGLSLSYFALKQLPVLQARSYKDDDLDFIVPRVLELCYTALDLKPFARDLNYNGSPFPWDEERRALLRAELDAYYAALYGLNRDELRYILDPADVYGPDFPGETFRVLKEREHKQYGEYRTQRLVLEAWDRLTLAPRNRDGRYAVEADGNSFDPREAGNAKPSVGRSSERGKAKREEAESDVAWPTQQAGLPGVGSPTQRSFRDLGAEN